MNNLRGINNDFDSYQQLINFYQVNRDKDFEVINLSINGWFSANMSSALGAIIEILKSNINDVKFVNLGSSVETILKKNNFLSYYGHTQLWDSNHTTIKYLKLKPIDGKYFKDYIFDELLGRNELPNMSQGVKNKIAEAIYEIFVNAQIHSETEYIFTCGQFYPQKDKIEFTITDIGVGFKNKINKTFNSNLTAEQAILWAVKDKNTVKKGTPGGIGLAFLKEFTEKNNGKIQIISNDGFYQFNDNKEETRVFTSDFPGTIVNLQFKTNDKSSYILTEEIDLDDIF
jgi:hypothetical protein